MSEKVFVKMPSSSVHAIMKNHTDLSFEFCAENKSGGIRISDGYHTMDELYYHRVTLFIALARERNARFQQEVWRSKANGDGSIWAGWFIMGIGRNKGEQITYHLPINRWEETEFAETLDKAPEFDGHTSEDVLKRLKSL